MTNRIFPMPEVPREDKCPLSIVEVAVASEIRFVKDEMRRRVNGHLERKQDNPFIAPILGEIQALRFQHEVCETDPELDDQFKLLKSQLVFEASRFPEVEISVSELLDVLHSLRRKKKEYAAMRKNTHLN